MESDQFVPVPGPANREDFDRAQRRHRRASWWFTLLSGLSVILTGIPMSAVITPLVYAAAFLVSDVVNLVVHVPDMANSFSQSSSTSSSPPTEWTPLLIAVVVVAALLPGALALFASWMGVRALFGRDSAGIELVPLGARGPTSGVLEEHQVGNLVQEMAIAAGARVPAVRILDSPVANAAVIGGDSEHATIVVTTGLLQSLNRDETSAVIGHLVGSAGNGDLRIGTTITSLFQTLGLAATVLGAPADKTTRRTMWRLLRYGFGRKQRKASEGAEIAALLARDDPIETPPDEKTGFMSVVTLPFLIASGAFTMTRMIFSMFLINPFIKRGWQARKYLADATAVELTRNPDGLARALEKLADQGDVVPGVAWGAHLFVVGPEAQLEGERLRMKHAVESLATQMPEASFSTRIDEARRLGLIPSGPGAAPAGDAPPVTKFFPPLNVRIYRVEQLGARSSEADPVPDPEARRDRRGCRRVALVVFAPLALVFGLVMLAIPLVLVGISFVIDMMFLAVVVLPIHAVLRSFGH